MNQSKFPWWSRPDVYRNASVLVAGIGSLLLSLNWTSQNMASFVGILVLFMAAWVAMAGVLFALKHQQIGLVVQCLLLLMWSVLLPLLLLSRMAF